MNQNFIGCVIILNIIAITGVIGYKNSTEMFILKWNFCCKNEVETESILHGNISLCEKVFYPCQGIAEFKKKRKKKKNYCFWKMREREIKLKAFPQQWVEAKEGLTLTAGWWIRLICVMFRPGALTHIHTQDNPPYNQ